MKRIIKDFLTVALLVVLAIPVMVIADGSIVTTNTLEVGTVKKLDIYWNSLTNRSDGSISWFCGDICRVIINDGAGQTNNFVAKITDSEGIDILKGAGTCSSNVIVDVCPAVQMYNAVTIGVTGSVPLVVSSPLTVAVTNTGVSSGKISIYYK